MEHIESKIEELKRRADERETIRYPKDFKEDAVEAVDRLRTKGWTQTAISEALGIPWVTLKRWRGDGEDSSKEEGSKGFVRWKSSMGQEHTVRPWYRHQAGALRACRLRNSSRSQGGCRDRLDEKRQRLGLSKTLRPSQRP